MCTAISITTANHYLGRTLDLHCSYNEEICVIPRNYMLSWRKMSTVESHYAMIGMATVIDGKPLYYDAANEHGLCMAGLNFPNNAYYPPYCEGKDNITPFEFIPWILSQCKTVCEARVLLGRINLVNIPFSDSLALSPLHWIISDKTENIVIEPMKDGLHIHESPVGVMTNNPPYPYHLFNLNNYRHLSNTQSESEFAEKLSLEHYCQGLGGIGLPGDVSSMSRFVRIVFGKENSICDDSESSSVGQVFHLLDSVARIKGICKLPTGEYDITIYSACINADKGLYYYTTYNNRQIGCVDMNKVDLNGDTVSRYKLDQTENIRYEN